MSSVTPNTVKNKLNKRNIYLSYIVNQYISDYDFFLGIIEIIPLP